MFQEITSSRSKIHSQIGNFHTRFCVVLLTVRILEHYVTIIPPNVSWIFQVFENTPCVQWFVNTLAKGTQGEEDKNIVAEYSDVALVTDLKSQSGKTI